MHGGNQVGPFASGSFYYFHPAQGQLEASAVDETGLRFMCQVL